MTAPETSRRVALVTLGCTRNEVDSEELAGRLAADGWELVADPSEADVAVVNTCGFVEQAKKESIDTLLEAADLREDPGARTQAVVAVGCLAERYGKTLAEELPDADAVLGFDSYAALSGHLRTVLAGGTVPSHTPSDRRLLLPLTPLDRPEAAASLAVPGHGATVAIGGSNAPVVRARLDGRPWAPLKIASGCDRRCSFCAIPSFRGSFVSRRPADVLTEARWLAERGVVELLLVSENSTSYGKDLGDLTLLERLLPELAAVDGIERVRVCYLQPAEIRPGLLDVLTSTPGVTPWFDLPFQHASAPLLRRMRRFGGRENFLDLVREVRRRAPDAGIRTNVIVGFPGETEEDLAELTGFLEEARLDVVGVFGYSDEEGTEAATFDDTLPEELVAERVEQVTGLVEHLMSARAEERVGERVRVLVEEIDEETQVAVGRAEHQGPEVDGVTVVDGLGPADVGRLVEAVVVATEGIDLVGEPA